MAPYSFGNEIHSDVKATTVRGDRFHTIARYGFKRRARSARGPSNAVAKVLNSGLAGETTVIPSSAATSILRAMWSTINRFAFLANLVLLDVLGEPR